MKDGIALYRVHGDQSDDGHGPDSLDEPLGLGHSLCRLVLTTGLNRNIRDTNASEWFAGLRSLQS